jgi:nucleoid-associated protein Lsr2
MAQKVQTLFIDDLDGSAAEGTVRFGLDGTEYEIDLNAGHARQLRDALAAYVLGGGSAVALVGLLAAGAGDRRAG